MPKTKYTQEMIANWMRKLDAGLTTTEAIADQAGIRPYDVTRLIKAFRDKDKPKVKFKF